MSLLSRIRRILGNERETPAHDVAPETKSANAIVSASKPEPPRYVDSKRNPNVPDTARWAVLNRCDYTRKSRAVTYVTRSKSGAPILIRRDLETREIIGDDNDSFALRRND